MVGCYDACVSAAVSFFWDAEAIVIPEPQDPYRD